MDFDRETLVELGAAAVPVVVLVAVLIVIGATMTGNGPSLTPAGGKAIVAALALFVLVFAGVGYWLARSDY